MNKHYVSDTCFEDMRRLVIRVLGDRGYGIRESHGSSDFEFTVIPKKTTKEYKTLPKVKDGYCQ